MFPHQLQCNILYAMRLLQRDKGAPQGRMGDIPRRVLQSSTTSSCTRLAVWIISVISANRRCLSVMSLHRPKMTCQSLFARS